MHCDSLKFLDLNSSASDMVVNAALEDDNRVELVGEMDMALQAAWSALVDLSC